MENFVIILVILIILGWGLQWFLYKIAIQKLGLHASWFWVFIVSAIAYTILAAGAYLRGYSAAPQISTGLIVLGAVAGILLSL